VTVPAAASTVGCAVRTHVQPVPALEFATRRRTGLSVAPQH
jgi:hypothetical protein